MPNINGGEVDVEEGGGTPTRRMFGVAASSYPVKVRNDSPSDADYDYDSCDYQEPSPPSFAGYGGGFAASSASDDGKSLPSLSWSIRSSQQRVDRVLRPALEKAGASVRHATDQATDTVQRLSVQFHESARAIAEHTVQTTRELSQTTVQTSRVVTLQAQTVWSQASEIVAEYWKQIGANPLERGSNDNDNNNNDNDNGGTVPRTIGRVTGQESDIYVVGCHPHQSCAIQAMAILTFVCAAAAMVLTETHLIDMASLFTMIVAPVLYWQTRHLNQLANMRAQQKLLYQQVHQFNHENKQLTTSLDILEQQVQQFQNVEQELRALAEEAGGEVDRLVGIVHENGAIQARIKELLDNDIIQQIVEKILLADSDRNYRLSKTEVRQLAYRLKNIPGVLFHHDRFQAFLASSSSSSSSSTCDGELSLSDLTRIARQLQDENVPAWERIFEYQPRAFAPTTTAAAAIGALPSNNSIATTTQATPLSSSGHQQQQQHQQQQIRVEM